MVAGKGVHYLEMRMAAPSTVIFKLVTKHGHGDDGILKSRASSGSLYLDTKCMQDKIGRIEGIDVEVQIIFKEEFISLLLPHFMTVGLDAYALAELINAYIASGEKVTYSWWFLDYGQRVINPMMNKKLKRDKDHPTFNKMLRHALKEELASDPVLLAFNKFKAK